ncbi:hypothetical protein GCM10023075_36150 [Streptosporangium album]
MDARDLGIDAGAGSGNGSMIVPRMSRDHWPTAAYGGAQLHVIAERGRAKPLVRGLTAGQKSAPGEGPSRRETVGTPSDQEVHSRQLALDVVRPLPRRRARALRAAAEEPRWAAS